MNFLLNIFLFGAVIGTYSSSILDLTDNFPEIRKDGGHWLVKFYAPWCGHCKKLEPIWAQVYHALAKSDINVRQIDCSRFPTVAAEFGVRGYPTIKFITKDSDYTFHGDRSAEELVNFAVRMAAPAVQEITKAEDLSYIKSTKKLFFMYVGNQEEKMYEYFRDCASKFHAQSYFYSTDPSIASRYFKIDDKATVLVHKENMSYMFTVEGIGEENNVNVSLYNWINEERFESFPKITRGNINEVLETNKYIVLVVIEEDKAHKISVDMLQFKQKVEAVLNSYRQKYHKHFQFGWISTPELANSIAMKVLPLPYLFVLNSTNYDHYVPEVDILEMTPEAIDIFLEGVYNQSVPAYGGNGLGARLYRTYFDASTALVDMWRGNPILTTVLFGLPVCFLSFILYSVCCADILDSDDEDEDEHTKQE